MCEITSMSISQLAPGNHINKVIEAFEGCPHITVVRLDESTLCISYHATAGISVDCSTWLACMRTRINLYNAKVFVRRRYNPLAYRIV